MCWNTYAYLVLYKQVIVLLCGSLGQSAAKDEHTEQCGDDGAAEDAQFSSIEQ